MNKFLLLTLLLPGFILAQSTVKTTYYKDKYGIKESTTGPYMLSISTVSDSVTKHVYSNTKNGNILWTKSFLGEQPYGIWKRFNKRGELASTRNYDFVVSYGEIKPQDAKTMNDLNLNHKTDPNKETIDSLVRAKFRYPELAQANDIQGRVTVQFTIGKDGAVAHLSILDGAHVYLDTECYRIMRNLKELQPYAVDGEEVIVYYTYVIVFKLA